MSMNGDLPKKWGWVSLSEACAINPGVDTSTVDDGELVSFVPMAAVEAGTGRLDVSQVRPLSDVRRGYTAFQDGDVIFAKITPCMENGKIAVASSLASGIAFGSTEFHVLRPIQSVDSHFLYHAVSRESLRREARQHMTGTAGQLRVPAKFLAQARIPLPPLAEQRRIVAAIEQQFTRLDAGVAALKRAQTALKQYRAAVLKAAVEGRLTEGWRAAHPDAEPAATLLKRILAKRRARWEADLRAKGKDPAKAKYEEPNTPDTANLQELPESWCWATVEQVSILVTDGDHNPPKRVPDGTPHLTAKNIADSRLDFEGCTFISEQDVVRVFQRYRPLAGDLIVTCVGTLGRTAIVPEGVVFSPDRNLAGVRTILGTGFTKWLQCCLQSPELQTIMGNISGSTAQPHLYLSDLRSLPIPLPPLVEQEQIVGEVERRLSVVSELEATIVANLKRAERLRQSILERAFSGRLVPQDPTDEPASALLERIHVDSPKSSKPVQLNLVMNTLERQE